MNEEYLHVLEENQELQLNHQRKNKKLQIEILFGQEPYRRDFEGFIVLFESVSLSVGTKPPLSPKFRIMFFKILKISKILVVLARDPKIEYMDPKIE